MTSENEKLEIFLLDAEYEITRLQTIVSHAHDRLLRGDSDKELLDILELAWKDRPKAIEFGAEKVQEYRDNGWIFKYEPETRFVGAYHPQGGKQSICELRNGFADDAFGFAIAAHLNGAALNAKYTPY